MTMTTEVSVMKIHQKVLVAIVILGMAAGVFAVTNHQVKMPFVPSKGKTLYQCSMHPQVVSDKPGNCPICDMRLTRVDSIHTASEKAETAKPKAKKILFYRHPM